MTYRGEGTSVKPFYYINTDAHQLYSDAISNNNSESNPFYIQSGNDVIVSNIMAEGTPWSVADVTSDFGLSVSGGVLDGMLTGTVNRTGDFTVTIQYYAGNKTIYFRSVYLYQTVTFIANPTDSCYFHRQGVHITSASAPYGSKYSSSSGAMIFNYTHDTGRLNSFWVASISNDSDNYAFDHWSSDSGYIEEDISLTAYYSFIGTNCQVTVNILGGYITKEDGTDITSTSTKVVTVPTGSTWSYARVSLISSYFDLTFTSEGQTVKTLRFRYLAGFSIVHSSGSGTIGQVPTSKIDIYYKTTVYVNVDGPGKFQLSSSQYTSYSVANVYYGSEYYLTSPTQLVVEQRSGGFSDTFTAIPNSDATFLYWSDGTQLTTQHKQVTTGNPTIKAYFQSNFVDCRVSVEPEGISEQRYASFTITGGSYSGSTYTSDQTLSLERGTSYTIVWNGTDVTDSASEYSNYRTVRRYASQTKTVTTDTEISIYPDEETPTILYNYRLVLTYDTNGGSWSGAEPITVGEWSQTVSSPPSSVNINLSATLTDRFPSKVADGVTMYFDHWVLDDTITPYYDVGASITARYLNTTGDMQNNHRMKAVWANGYKIVIRYNDGSDDRTAIIKQGTDFSLPTVNMRTNYYFRGWCVGNLSVLNVIGLPNDTIRPTSDMTILGFWRDTPVITFDAGEGTFPNGGGRYAYLNTQTIDYAWNTATRLQSLPTEPTHPTYAFDGWYLNNVQITVNTEFAVDSDYTVTADWVVEIPPDYRIEIESVSDPIMVTVGQITTVTARVYPDDAYPKLKWRITDDTNNVFSIAVNENTRTVNIGAKSLGGGSASATLTAWCHRDETPQTGRMASIGIQATNSSVVTFYTSKISTMPYAQITTDNQGMLPELPPEPTKEGYDFNGWYSDIDKRISMSEPIPYSVDAYANYTQIETSETLGKDVMVIQMPNEDKNGIMTTIDLGSITSFSESYSISTSSTPTPKTKVERTFVVDYQITENITVGYLRVSPVIVDDSSEDSKKWSNAYWIKNLRNASNRWQAQTDGVKLLFLPLDCTSHEVEPGNVIYYGDRYKLLGYASNNQDIGYLYNGIRYIGVNAYIKTVSMKYVSGSPDTISGSITFTLGGTRAMYSGGEL